MPGVAVVTDSTSSLSARQAVRSRVRVVPLQVVIDGVSRAEDEVPPAEVAQALREGRAVSTSRPTPESFAATYAELLAEGCSSIVSVHLSAGLSGTVAAAQQAAAGAGTTVRVVDSRTIGMATGFAALAGAEAAAAGAAPERVAAVAGRRAAASATYFSVADLGHLRRGGRIGSATAAIGSALSVKPLLNVVEGEIRPFERVRTASRALHRLQELAVGAGSRTPAGVEVDVAVHHLDDEATALRLAEALRSRLTAARSVQVCELSAVLGVHAGPGTLGVVVSPVV